MTFELTSDLLSLFLPQGILDYFVIESFEKSEKTLTLHLKEKDIPPKEYENRNPRPRGFMDARVIEDFPIRGLQVKLSIVRRRWSIDSTNQKVSRNWDLVAEGTRMTNEFASFLKGIVG